MNCRMLLVCISNLRFLYSELQSCGLPGLRFKTGGGKKEGSCFVLFDLCSAVLSSDAQFLVEV